MHSRIADQSSFAKTAGVASHAVSHSLDADTTNPSKPSNDVSAAHQESSDDHQSKGKVSDKVPSVDMPCTRMPTFSTRGSGWVPLFPQDVHRMPYPPFAISRLASDINYNQLLEPVSNCGFPGRGYTQHHISQLVPFVSSEGAFWGFLSPWVKPQGSNKEPLPFPLQSGAASAGSWFFNYRSSEIYPGFQNWGSKGNFGLK